MGYEDLTKIQQDTQNAINKNNQVYEQLITDQENLYNDQLNKIEQSTQLQNDALDKQLAHNTELINQQKEKTQKSYETETKKALNAYNAFNNPYGYNAETMASQGLTNSGVSETSKLGSFNTYQNRLASAYRTMTEAITSYDNDINAAILANDVAKAENAVNKLNQELAAMESYFTNKGNLVQSQFANEQSIRNTGFNQYQTIWENIKAEEAAAENRRRWEAEMAEEQRQFNILHGSTTNGGIKGSGKKASVGLAAGLAAGLTGNNGNNKTTTYKNSGLTVDDVFLSLSTKLGKQPILEANGRYWVEEDGDYVDVTTEVNQFLGKGWRYSWSTGERLETKVKTTTSSNNKNTSSKKTTSTPKVGVSVGGAATGVLTNAVKTAVKAAEKKTGVDIGGAVKKAVDSVIKWFK